MCVCERERRKARDTAIKTKHGLQVTSYYSAWYALADGFG
jgi:hypothetical protein